MVTRRHFLGLASTGLLASAAACQPRHASRPTPGDAPFAKLDASLVGRAQLAATKNLLLGYPVNMTTPPDEFFAWRRELYKVGIGSFSYNNVGNPFLPQSAMPFNTHDFESEVIRRFGQLFAFPPGKVWGFLSHSGTDSNMHGMYIGRKILSARTGLTPKAYFTKEAHYSVQILQDLLGLEAITVETEPDGGMDPDDLKKKLNAHADHPALVVATFGTTFKGAIDPIDRIQMALQGHPSYLHLDAALFGGYLPYTAHASELFQRAPSDPGRPRYDSIAVSCHKFFGLPAPAGLFITTEDHYREFADLFSKVHNPDYIHQVPGTITCSRDAVKPAEFYFFSTPEAKPRLKQAAHDMLANTAYLMEQMQRHFAMLEPVRLNNRSNIVYFRYPGNKIVQKYSLATVRLDGSGARSHAHVVVMPHASREVLAQFLTDLQYEQASPSRGKGTATAERDYYL